MKLGDYCESLAYEIAFWAQSLSAPTFPADELGDVAIELSRKFRVLAIALLLSRGDGRAFQDNLHRSGRTRAAYLERVRKEQLVDDHHAASGRYAALLDAVAARSWDTAREIVGLSRADFHEGHEYPDDYCFAQLIGSLVDPKPEDVGADELFGAWEEFLDGATDPRFDVCASLYARDARAFEESFTDLLRSRESEIDEAVERGQISEADTFAERQIFVDGLALLTLAESLGLPTEAEYMYCPAVARVERRTPFPIFPA